MNIHRSPETLINCYCYYGSVVLTTDVGVNILKSPVIIFYSFFYYLCKLKPACIIISFASTKAFKKPPKVPVILLHRVLHYIDNFLVELSLPIQEQIARSVLKPTLYSLQVLFIKLGHQIMLYFFLPMCCDELHHDAARVVKEWFVITLTMLYSFCSSFNEIIYNPTMLVINIADTSQGTHTYLFENDSL